VSCEAKLDRFDTITRTRTDSYDLAHRTGATALIPAATGALEVCLANQTVFDASASVFYTLVPSRARPADDGTNGYRVLGFSVPAVTLVKQVSAGDGLDRPPHVELGPGGTIRTVRASDWTPRTEETMSAFAPAHQSLPNRIVERSGDRALIGMFGPAGELAVGVADEASKTFVRLQGGPTTTSRTFT